MFGAHPSPARAAPSGGDGLGAGHAQGQLLQRILIVLEATAAFVRAGQDVGAFVDGDAKQIVLTVLGAQVTAFAVGNLVEQYAGERSPSLDEAFIEARSSGDPAHVRGIVALRAPSCVLGDDRPASPARCSRPGGSTVRS